ncbi:MAG: threonine synthase [Gemmatimonadota bacterium]|nr:threonine synthase [Gemmatimonadota bacterium]
MTSFYLECGACGSMTDPIPLAALCTACGSPQLVCYRTVSAGSGPALRDTWATRQGGMWRYRELLPLLPGEAPVSLGEGGTPLVPLPRMGEALDLKLLMKDEGGNPTGSFKDRGLSAAVTRAVHDGAQRFVLPSAGNAGVALAAYAARAGVPATIFIPVDTPKAVFDRCAAYQADVVPVDGLISDCGTRAAAHAAETGAFDLATLREPYRIEGKKTMGLEILEALDWRAPDAVIYPAGGGTGLIGTWKALREAAALRLIDRPVTRLYAVQAAGCAPIVRAWEAGHDAAQTWVDARTAAWGLRVPSARGDGLMLRALRESGGGAISVEDSEMRAEARRVACTDGLAAGIEGGATLAAAARLRERGDLAAGETVIVFNTGNLWNYGRYTG